MEIDDGFAFSDVAFFFAVWLLSPLIVGVGAVLWVWLHGKG